MRFFGTTHGELHALWHSELMGLDPHLARLVGTWRGDGFGCYPTIADFTYTDEITFTDIGKPFLHFVQRTWIKGEPRHTEVLANA